MTTLDDRISNLDVSLFAAIPSETSDHDKRALLLTQACVREFGEYVYLEIGSHLGGTVQSHYLDPACKLIFSIDKRPKFQPDERGLVYRYDNNSTKRMLENLFTAFPSVKEGKVITFDCDASSLAPGEIIEKPNLCLIDGEHTNSAVVSDFKFCLRVCHPNSIIVFHDTCLVFNGVGRIKKFLSSHSIKFRGFMLAGSVYTILLNEAVTVFGKKIEQLSVDEAEYFHNSKGRLRKIRWKHRKQRIVVFFCKYPLMKQWFKRIIRLIKKHNL